MKPKKKKIGEILLENKFITREILDEALEYQRKFGGGVTQYLVTYGYIDEEVLAKCVSEQFSFPYLPLGIYNIPDEVVKLVPLEISEKYWLMPVDRMGDILTVVMADPLDTAAIEEIEKVTGYRVQQFVGVLSDIIKSIERYYNITIEDKRLKKDKAPFLFIDTKAYEGLERRKSVRLTANIEVHFPMQDLYKKSKAKNISLNGFLFESENILPFGSYIALEINLPEEFSAIPIACIVQVVRVIPLKNKKFDIGAKLIKIPAEDARAIMKYARAHSKYLDKEP